VSGLSQRGAIAVVGIAIAALAVLIVWQVGPLLAGGPAATGTPGVQPSPTPAPSIVVVAPTQTATPVPPTPAPPTPEPTPPMVASALTGLLISQEAAILHPIAVMVDDHSAARPQSGFNSAAIVWHAPAEGGVPRYMMIFQDEIPTDVGPIRSSREYYIEWAAEWNAMYVHFGGSPQALATLARKGGGQWVWNADGFRWSPKYMWRITERFAPHNVYTDGEHLRALAARLGAADEPLSPAWTFGAAAAPDKRPLGGSITVVYPYETITYRYDSVANRYVRYINKSKKPQVDAADGSIVAPANVVILRMRFGPLNDGHPNKFRLEASNVGKGEAWISTNGVTVKGTWKKASETAPTLLFGPDGKPFALTPGQTFVQVLPLTYGYSFEAGLPQVTPPMGAEPDPA